MTSLTRSLLAALTGLLLCLPGRAQAGTTVPVGSHQTNPIVSGSPVEGSFALVGKDRAAPLWTDAADWPGVLRAARDLQADIERVTGLKPALVTDAASGAKQPVLIGTIGRSSLIDGLIKSGKLNGDAIREKWEAFIIETVEKPLPGIDRALVIAGSDKRGTIYGIYELS